MAEVRSRVGSVFDKQVYVFFAGGGERFPEGCSLFFQWVFITFLPRIPFFPFLRLPSSLFCMHAERPFV